MDTRCDTIIDVKTCNVGESYSGEAANQGVSPPLPVDVGYTQENHCTDADCLNGGSCNSEGICDCVIGTGGPTCDSEFPINMTELIDTLAFDVSESVNLALEEMCAALSTNNSHTLLTRCAIYYIVQNILILAPSTCSEDMISAGAGEPLPKLHEYKDELWDYKDEISKYLAKFAEHNYNNNMKAADKPKVRAMIICLASAQPSPLTI